MDSCFGGDNAHIEEAVATHTYARVMGVLKLESGVSREKGWGGGGVPENFCLPSTFSFFFPACSIYMSLFYKYEIQTDHTVLE